MGDTLHTADLTHFVTGTHWDTLAELGICKAGDTCCISARRTSSLGKTVSKEEEIQDAHSTFSTLQSTRRSLHTARVGYQFIHT